MKCPQCGEDNTPNALFCDNCGAALAALPATLPPVPAVGPGVPAPQPLAPASPAPVWQSPPVPAAQAPSPGPQPPAVASATCPACGVPVMAGAMFCDNCGGDLRGTAVPAPPLPAQAPPAPGPTTLPAQAVPGLGSPPPAPAPFPAIAAPQACPNCHQPVVADTAFCSTCGYSLRPAAPTPPVPAGSQGAAVSAPAPVQPTPAVAPAPQAPSHPPAAGPGQVAPATLPIQPGTPPPGVSAAPPLPSFQPADPPPPAPAAPACQPAPPPPAAPATCPQCHEPVHPGEPFCGHCGIALPTGTGRYQATPASVAGAPAAPFAPQPPVQATVACPACRAPNPTQGRFCDTCGAPLAGMPPIVGPGLGVTPSAGGSPRLVVLASQAQILLASGRGEWLLGREDPVAGVFPEVDLTLHGGDSGGVSRKHCLIRQHGAQFTIVDLGSTNFTTVNKIRLSPNVPQVLNEGDEVRLGRIVLQFHTA